MFVPMLQHRVHFITIAVIMHFVTIQYGVFVHCLLWSRVCAPHYRLWSHLEISLGGQDYNWFRINPVFINLFFL